MSLRAFITRLIGRLGILPFRILSYLLHATGLERIYKPRFHRYVGLTEIDDTFISRLPRYCRTITGAESDPINLIVVGSEREIKRSFRAAGWHRANPASPLHIGYGLLSMLLKRSYTRGPFAPLYINIGLQDLAFQRTGGRRGFRERHHVRLWQTGYTLSDGQMVWVAAGGHEDGVSFTFALPFFTHTLDPDIDSERRFIAAALRDEGAQLLKYVSLTPKITRTHPKRTVFGSVYYTDGRAAVLELHHGA